jgi:hypothetical protein
MHNFMLAHDSGFAWSEDKRGSFRTDFFPPVDFPVIPHTPWVERNFPIPPGIYEDVCAIVQKKLATGIYEPLNPSYRSQWFCVLKKDGKALCPVHSLKPLNRTTIQHSGIPPCNHNQRPAPSCPQQQPMTWPTASAPTTPDMETRKKKSGEFFFFFSLFSFCLYLINAPDTH